MQSMARHYHLLAAVLIVFASTIIHYPGFEGYLYSDIVYIFASRVGEVLEEGSGGLIIPGRDFYLEYPPLVWLLWLASVNLARYFQDPLTAHYMVHAIVLGASLVASVAAVERLAGRERALLAALLPSAGVYGVYNWDLLAIAPLLWGLVYLRRGRWLAGGLLIGVGGAAKLLPLVAAAPLVVRGREGLKAYSVAVAVTAVSFALVEVAAPGYIETFYRHHSNWYIEGSWLLILGDPFNERVRDAAKIASAIAVLLAVAYSRRARLALEDSLFTSITAYLLTTYLYTPQMNLFPSLLLLSSPTLAWSLVPLLQLQDLSAAAVILVWSLSTDPLNPYSPASIATYVKCVLLFALMIIHVYRARNIRGLEVLYSRPS